MNKTIEIKEQFKEFIGKNVIVEFKNNTKTTGKVKTVDNYLNIVLYHENGEEVIKGEKISYISIKED